MENIEDINDINQDNNNDNDNEIKKTTISKPWYYVNETSDVKELIDTSPDIKLPELPLNKLHDTVATYCFVANEARIKATYYQHQ